MRRYTENLESERFLIELQKAQRKYKEGKKMFEQQNYFDCLMKLSKALDSFDTMEPPS